MDICFKNEKEVRRRANAAAARKWDEEWRAELKRANE